MSESFKQKPADELSVGEAEATINGIMNEAFVMGGNDYEKDAFSNILRALHEGGITAKEAVAQATKILKDKQDYH